MPAAVTLTVRYATDADIAALMRLDERTRPAFDRNRVWDVLEWIEVLQDRKQCVVWVVEVPRGSELAAELLAPRGMVGFCACEWATTGAGLVLAVENMGYLTWAAGVRLQHQAQYHAGRFGRRVADDRIQG